MNELEFIQIFENSSKKYGVHLMLNESVVEQELFLESFYRSFGYRKQLDLKWLSWYYNQNPFGLCNNYILVDIEKAAWIGGFGFSKIAYKINNVNVIGGLGINGFIDSDYKGKGLYTKLISIGLQKEYTKDRIFFSFPHANNIPSIKGHLKSGWQPLVSLSFIELEIEERKLNFSEAICLEKPEELKYLNFELFDNYLSFSFSRNFDFLYWRFIRRPNKNYSYICVDIDENIGYMILGFYETQDSIKRCQIADYRYTSDSCLKQLINKAYWVANKNRCNILDVLINNESRHYGLFSSFGFTPRKEGYELFTFSENPVLLQNGIFITYGDFDAV